MFALTIKTLGQILFEMKPHLFILRFRFKYIGAFILDSISLNEK